MHSLLRDYTNTLFRRIPLGAQASWGLAAIGDPGRNARTARMSIDLRVTSATVTKMSFESEQPRGSALVLVTAVAAALLSAGLMVVQAWNALGETAQIAGGVGGFAVVAVLTGMALRQFVRPRLSGQRLKMTQIDGLSGVQFELCVAELLARQGYSVDRVGHSGDLGVDIVARKGGRRFAVQCKRYASPVSRRAISDAVAGVRHYGCDGAMVVTNSVFTRDAITLAHANRCLLVDRSALAKWLRA